MCPLLFCLLFYSFLPKTKSILRNGMLFVLLFVSPSCFVARCCFLILVAIQWRNDLINLCSPLPPSSTATWRPQALLTMKTAEALTGFRLLSENVLRAMIVSCDDGTIRRIRPINSNSRNISECLSGCTVALFAGCDCGVCQNVWMPNRMSSTWARRATMIDKRWGAREEEFINNSQRFYGCFNVPFRSNDVHTPDPVRRLHSAHFAVELQRRGDDVGNSTSDCAFGR